MEFENKKCTNENKTLIWILLINFTNISEIEAQNQNTVELQWLEQLWKHENMFETRDVRANERFHSARSGGIIGIYLFL